MVIINTNDTVSFKPTAAGWKLILIQSHYPIERNKEGIVEMELWKLMSLFGQFMHNGCVQLIKDNEITVVRH